MKRHVLVLTIAVLGLAVVPATARTAVTKIPVTLTFTSVASDGAISGQVTSTKAKCASGIDVFGRNGNVIVSTLSDDQGNFVYDEEFLGALGFESFDSYVQQGQKFGKKGRKKRCEGATGTVSFTHGSTEIDTIQFNDATNTFSGTLSSEVPACATSAPLELSHRSVGSDEYVFDRAFTSSSGTFSVPYGAEPEPGFWAVDSTSFIGASTVGSENASVTFCDPGFGKAVEIPASSRR